MSSIRCFITIIFCFIISSLLAQTPVDSLNSNSYQALYNAYLNAKTFQSRNLYADNFLFKAKRGNSRDDILEGYLMKANIIKDDNLLNYCDSIILLSKNESNKYFPTLAYYKKAKFYYDHRDFKKSLDNSIESLKFSKKYEDKKNIARNNLLIGLLKLRMYEYDDAIDILKENYKYSIDYNIESTVLPTIFALGTVYNEIKVLDSATYYNKLGFKKSIDNDLYQNYFRLNEGVVSYYRKSYSEAYDSINNSIPYLKKTNDLPNLAVSYFYKAKVYESQGDFSKMLFNLKKVDTIFNAIQDLHPKIRDTYDMLISYYRNDKNYREQLYYINRLIRLDSILHQNELYINKNLIERYDIPKLVTEKSEIIESLKRKEQNKKFVIFLMSSFFIILFLLLYYQYHRRKLYKKRYLEVVEQNKNVVKRQKKISQNPDLNKLSGISEEVITTILKELKRFEDNNSFLNIELTANSLAKQIGTNVKYLSKVINHYKNESFINYVNGLRIQYTVERLKNDNNFRKYTLVAIANEVGFKKAESFSRAFKKVTDITPSFFIKELIKNKNFISKFENLDMFPILSPAKN